MESTKKRLEQITLFIIFSESFVTQEQHFSLAFIALSLRWIVLQDETESIKKIDPNTTSEGKFQQKCLLSTLKFYFTKDTRASKPKCVGHRRHKVGVF